MAAGRYNIVVDQGSDFALQFTVKSDGTATNLTGYSARAQLRERPHTGTVTATFTCTIVSASAGTIKMALTNEVTKAITPKKYYYDLEIYTTNDAAVTRLLQGEALVSPEVTR
jgi:hypothetical protein|tara:strand:- start:397 stop:735 length:339 start_codon:yes stop_codon:yes gene_type:complete